MKKKLSPITKKIVFSTSEVKKALCYYYNKDIEYTAFCKKCLLTITANHQPEATLFSQKVFFCEKCKLAMVDPIFDHKKLLLEKDIVAMYLDINGVKITYIDE